MTTAGAVSPCVSPVLISKEVPTPPSGESGAGNKGHALLWVSALCAELAWEISCSKTQLPDPEASASTDHLGRDGAN